MQFEKRPPHLPHERDEVLSIALAASPFSSRRVLPVNVCSLEPAFIEKLIKEKIKAALLSGHEAISDQVVICWCTWIAEFEPSK
jgi:hypothetical protein